MTSSSSSALSSSGGGGRSNAAAASSAVQAAKKGSGAGRGRLFDGQTIRVAVREVRVGHVRFTRSDLFLVLKPVWPSKWTGPHIVVILRLTIIKLASNGLRIEGDIRYDILWAMRSFICLSCVTILLTQSSHCYNHKLLWSRIVRLIIACCCIYSKSCIDYPYNSRVITWLWMMLLFGTP